MKKSHVVLNMEDYHTLVHQSEQFKEYVNTQLNNTKPIGLRTSPKVFEVPQWVYIFESEPVIDEMKASIANCEAIILDLKSKNKGLKAEMDVLVKDIRLSNNEAKKMYNALEAENKLLKDELDEIKSLPILGKLIKELIK